MIKNEYSLYSKHIKGQEQFIADKLSRNFDLTKDELTNFFPIIFPKQAPPNFHLVDHPEEIS